MTRQHISITELAETRDASLPTSRHATNGRRAVLAVLRSLAPHRQLTLPEAIDLAERQAERLIQLAELTEPPTPSALIAELPRVIVRTDNDLPVSAGSCWVSGRWLLIINGSEPLVRQRFSLGHEYAHSVMHPYAQTMFVDQPGLSAGEQRELVADAFAAALLMPAAWVERAWRGGTRQLSDLSQLFQVHPRAMARRLDRLGLRPLPAADPAHLGKAV